MGLKVLISIYLRVFNTVSRDVDFFASLVKRHLLLNEQLFPFTVDLFSEEVWYLEI